MAIEFHCPNGHILEVDDIHAGVQIRCPACDVKCLVPPAGAAPVETAPAQPEAEMIPTISTRKPRKRAGGAPGRRLPLDVAVPEIGEESLVAEQPAPSGIVIGGGIGAENRKLLHIHCSKCDQQLEFTNEMLGEDLACPACGHVFKATLTKTIEYQREKRIKEEREERQLSERWLYAAIFAGLLIFAGIIAMVALSAGQ
ncbi:MAG: hypothetical protein MI757_22750 [Pirellulales bacterium]|nr:hypothetical protein [Pirellulales bacterium]